MEIKLWVHKSIYQYYIPFKRVYKAIQRYKNFKIVTLLDNDFIVPEDFTVDKNVLKCFKDYKFIGFIENANYEQGEH